MSMVSHLHHLFNPDTCQSYIHTLRGKDQIPSDLVVKLKPLILLKLFYGH